MNYGSPFNAVSKDFSIENSTIYIISTNHSVHAKNMRKLMIDKDTSFRLVCLGNISAPPVAHGNILASLIIHYHICPTQSVKETLDSLYNIAIISEFTSDNYET